MYKKHHITMETLNIWKYFTDKGGRIPGLYIILPHDSCWRDLLTGVEYAKELRRRGEVGEHGLLFEPLLGAPSWINWKLLLRPPDSIDRVLGLEK